MIPVKTIDLSDTKEVHMNREGICDFMIYLDGEPFLTLQTEGGAASVATQLEGHLGHVVTVFRCYDRNLMHTFYRVLRED